MNARKRKSLTNRLWRQFATKDKHGYQDTMSEGSFENAIAELINLIKAKK